MYHLLTGLITFVVVDVSTCVSFNVIHHIGMDFTKIVNSFHAVSEISLLKAFLASLPSLTTQTLYLTYSATVNCV
jgi:hypothetical protein